MSGDLSGNVPPEPPRSAESVRCQASISGNCLSLTEGWSLCEEGECVYGAFFGEMPDDGQGAALIDGLECDS